ncbi:hypothetical protein DWB84_04975 [Saccharophagus sp. K07]|jgi:hypothetical protein|uniref:hypothetical protein n=1 Tax=Saccharophagus sp. K07 TaxID=2283636 RepID=UPI0016525836|nr:hypothetical protein [Saccharophagus sp. K07]MBC6904814.1 hypothetical protein [Saccharophagus sp. K07]
MLACFAWLLMATIFVQVPNLLGVHEQHKDGLVSVMDATKIAFFTIPITFIATAGFALYYGRAEQYFSYPAMVIYAHIAALMVGIVIQVLFLKSKEINVLEWVGLAIALLGLVLSVYSKAILVWFKSG